MTKLVWRIKCYIRFSFWLQRLIKYTKCFSRYVLKTRPEIRLLHCIFHHARCGVLQSEVTTERRRSGLRLWVSVMVVHMHELEREQCNMYRTVNLCKVRRQCRGAMQNYCTYFWERCTGSRWDCRSLQRNPEYLWKKKKTESCEHHLCHHYSMYYYELKCCMHRAKCSNDTAADGMYCDIMTDSEGTNPLSSWINNQSTICLLPKDRWPYTNEMIHIHPTEEAKASPTCTVLKYM